MHTSHKSNEAASILSQPRAPHASDRRNRHRNWKRVSLAVALLVGTSGCQPFGLRLRDTAQSNITVEPLGPPSQSEQLGGSRSDRKVHPTLAAAKKARERDSRSQEMARNGSNPDGSPSIIDSDTPEADLEKSLESLPPAMQAILARQMLAVDAYQKNKGRDSSAKEEIAAASKNETKEPSEIAKVQLGKPELIAGEPPLQPNKDKVPANDDRLANALSAARESLTPKSKQEGVRRSLSDSGTEPSSEVQLASTHSHSKGNPEPANSVIPIPATSALPAMQTAEQGRDEGALSWQRHLQKTIDQLQSQLESDKSMEENVRLQLEANLRLLLLANGKLDDSMKKIPELTEEEQKYFSYQLKSLHDAFRPGGDPFRMNRWSLVMSSQKKAMEQLSAVSKLEISSAAFCTAVDGYGVISKFPKYQFRPDEDVLLYCELDNVASVELKDGYETQLRGNYQILDRNNARVFEQVLPTEREICKNRRRDYFIAYRIYMPSQIAPGDYQFRLSIEDMKAHKFGQATIDFQIQK